MIVEALKIHNARAVHGAPHHQAIPRTAWSNFELVHFADNRVQTGRVKIGRLRPGPGPGGEAWYGVPGGGRRGSDATDLHRRAGRHVC